MRLHPISFVSPSPEISHFAQLVSPMLSRLDTRVELDKELAERVAQLAFVDPCGESREEGDGERLEESGAEITDEGISVRGSRVER